MYPQNTYAGITIVPGVPKQNFIIRHWHGDLSPAWSSAIGIAGAVFPLPVMAGFVVGFAMGFVGGMSGTPPTQATYTLVNLLVWLGIAVWASVGMFMSGWRNRRRAGGVVVAVLAGLLVVFVGLSTIGTVVQMNAPPPAQHYHVKH